MASLSGWTEAGVGVILFMVLVGLIIGSMNTSYNKNYDPTFGISTTNDSNSFSSYQGTLGTSLQGEATQNQNGLSLTTSWSIIQQGLSLVLNLVTGQWITNAIGLLNFGAVGKAFALALRLVFVFSLGFILLKILFKVKP